MTSPLSLFALCMSLGIFSAAEALPVLPSALTLLALLLSHLQNRWLVPIGLFFGACCFSLHHSTALRPLEALTQDGPTPLLVEGTVLAGPYPAFASDGTARWRMEIETAFCRPKENAMALWFPCSGRSALTTETLPSQLALGDTFRASLTLSPLPSADNPGQVDSNARIRDQGRDTLAFATQITRLSGPPPDTLTHIRAIATRFFNDHLSGSARSILGALILGETGSLPPDLRDRFAASGTAHLLAVSGGHVVIVAWLIHLLLQLGFSCSPWLMRAFLTRRLSSLLAAPSVLFYVAFVGAQPSALRAGISSAVALLLQALGRKISGATLLSVSAIVSLALEPSELFGPSLQLSFLAVIGLFFFHKPLLAQSRRIWPILRAPHQSRTRRTLHWLFENTRELLVSTLAATIATTPLTAWHFQQISPAALLANLIMVPLVSLLLLPLGLVAATCAIVQLPNLATPLLQACETLWSFLEKVLLAVSPQKPTPYLMQSLEFCLWALLLASLLRFSGSTRRWSAAALGLLLVLLRLSPRLQEETLRITFLSIGQGDCAVIEIPGGYNILVDGGGNATGHDDPGRRVILPFLRWRGITQLDAIVLSHPHPDHFGGLASVAAEIPTKALWFTHAPGRDPRYQALISAVETKIFPEDGPDPYHNFPKEIGKARFFWLGPSDGIHGRPFTNDENNNSLVFLLQYGEHRFLFPGDAEVEAEEQLLQQNASALQADLIKVGHHGSRSSSHEAFLAAVQPKIAVFCVGKWNRYGFPHPEVYKRLAARKTALFRTDEGAVVVESDGKQLRTLYKQTRSFLGEVWPIE